MCVLSLWTLWVLRKEGDCMGGNHSSSSTSSSSSSRTPLRRLRPHPSQWITGYFHISGKYAQIIPIFRRLIMHVAAVLFTHHPHRSSSSSAIVYRWSECSPQSGERGRGITTTLADVCLYFKEHLDILPHLSPITSCLPLHLSLSARVSCPSLSLPLTPPSSPTSYFSWFIVRQSVSVRPRLPLCVCERVVLFMVLPAINHVFLRCGKIAEGKNDGRWTDDIPEQERKGDLATTAVGCSEASLALLVPALCPSFSSFPHAFTHKHTPSIFTFDCYWVLVCFLLFFFFFSCAVTDEDLELLRQPINASAAMNAHKNDLLVREKLICLSRRCEWINLARGRQRRFCTMSQ